MPERTPTPSASIRHRAGFGSADPIPFRKDRRAAVAASDRSLKIVTQLSSLGGFAPSGRVTPARIGFRAVSKREILAPRLLPKASFSPPVIKRHASAYHQQHDHDNGNQHQSGPGRGEGFVAAANRRGRWRCIGSLPEASRHAQRVHPRRGQPRLGQVCSQGSGAHLPQRPLLPIYAIVLPVALGELGPLERVRWQPPQAN